MKKCLLLCLILSIAQRIHKDPLIDRNPASSAAIDAVLSACDHADSKNGSYTVCGPYKETRKVVEKKANEMVKVVVETITPEVAAVSGFVLKSLYEKRISLEVKTSFGKPAVSIKNNETLFNWSIEHNF